MLPEHFMRSRKLVISLLGILLTLFSLSAVANYSVSTALAANGCFYTEEFSSLPAWSSEHDAQWGVPADWSAGTVMQATRPEAGSSTKVKVYTVPGNTLLRLTVYMKGAAGSDYWTEAAYRLGNRDAEDFDTNAQNWTLINKFDSFGDYPDGNGDVWTPYSVTVNTGQNDNITIGYKAGSVTSEYPGGYWDNLSICMASEPTPTPAPTPPPPFVPTCVADETFNTLPVWESTWSAPWGGGADWTASGYLKATNPSPGSSSVVKVYPIAPDTNYTLEIAMYGSRGRSYWTETAYKLGTHTARDFDETPGTWTIVNKLGQPGLYPNGTEGIWRWTDKNFYSFANSTITVGFKAGHVNSSFPYPGGYWDDLLICANSPAF